MERRIIEAVARADMLISSALRRLPVILALAALLAAFALIVRARRGAPRWIDYDAPGVDITSEGPEGYTEEYDDWRDAT